MSFRQKLLKWSEFTSGDVIATDPEIKKLVSGSVKEDDIKRFVILDNNLHTFPDLLRCVNPSPDILFRKLYTVKFEQP